MQTMDITLLTVARPLVEMVRLVQNRYWILGGGRPTIRILWALAVTFKSLEISTRRIVNGRTLGGEFIKGNYGESARHSSNSNVDQGDDRRGQKNSNVEL